LDALPGITGLAQLRELQGDRSVNPLDLDMQYLAGRTLLGDFGLLLRTAFLIARQPLHTQPTGVSIESRS
ncbi:MAG: sugar transferase, partial [Bryobacteraceae bacterium]|nr:sugar transferase [Bryobacteraceae bacterium]